MGHSHINTFGLLSGTTVHRPAVAFMSILYQHALMDHYVLLIIR